ncbi:hypothetical protein Nepgr_017220 [Nepenthes gracilis]|uniref:Uncharacterized protein n=1 Tax=Nepenthes gracilis TaxID=150966 RepID=A0AAD3SR34_NEPGR|nr:hypothetical protein Nepgr_017220 [Nepenthes gracilis]
MMELRKRCVTSVFSNIWFQAKRRLSHTGEGSECWEFLEEYGSWPCFVIRSGVRVVESVEGDEPAVPPASVAGDQTVHAQVELIDVLTLA